MVIAKNDCVGNRLLPMQMTKNKVKAPHTTNTTFLYPLRTVIAGYPCSGYHLM